MSAEVTRHPSLDELSAWVDGEIGGDLERRVLAEHVEACASCASLVEDFRALAGAQAAAPAPPLPPRLEKRIRDALARDGRPVRSTARRFVLPLSAAATVLVAVAALWLLRQEPGRSLPPRLDSVPTRPTAAEREEAAPQAEPVPLPPPQLERKLERKREAFQAPPVAPPQPEDAPASEEAATGRMAGLADAESQVAMPAPPFRWTRRASSEAFSKTSPAASAGGDTAACPVLDVLEPSLDAPGLDVAEGEALAERAREAGATGTTLEGRPRLTLLVPVRAWPQVRATLIAAGVALPDAALALPRDAVCLVVTVDGDEPTLP